jgi:hypothetical protein
MDFKSLLKAYQTIAEAEKKQKALDKMAAGPLNYGIIRDLMNSAYNGVVVSVRLADGTTLEIKRQDAFDRLQKNYQEGF